MRALNLFLAVLTLPLRPLFWAVCRFQAKPCPKCGEKWFTTLTGEWGEEDWECVCGHTWSVPYWSNVPVLPTPVGVMPKWLWDEIHPTPSASDLKSRLSDIDGARLRRRDAGLPPLCEWEEEAASRRGELVLSDGDLEGVSAGKAHAPGLQAFAAARGFAPRLGRTPATKVASDATPTRTCEGGVCR